MQVAFPVVQGFALSRLADLVFGNHEPVCHCVVETRGDPLDAGLLKLLEAQLERCGPANLHPITRTTGVSVLVLVLCCVFCASIAGGAGYLAGKNKAERVRDDVVTVKPDLGKSPGARPLLQGGRGFLARAVVDVPGSGVGVGDLDA